MIAPVLIVDDDLGNCSYVVDLGGGRQHAELNSTEDA